MDIKLIFVVLKTKYVQIIFTLIVAVAIAAGITAAQSKWYVAYTSLVLNISDRNPFDQSGGSAQLSATYFATHLDILQSQNVAVKVVKALELDKNETIISEYQEETLGLGVSLVDWIAIDLMKNLRVEPSRDSRVVRVGYMSTVAKESAVTADAFAQAYIATTLELSMEPARRSAGWFDLQLTELRERLENAQSRLTGYQQEKGIIAIDERLDTETSRLAELSKSLIAAQANLVDVQNRQLGRNHPEYRRAVGRERSSSEAVAQQKRRLLELKGQRDELGALVRELENEQRNYDATLQSYYQTRLESQFNQTRIAVLSPAVVPQRPVSPNVILNIASAIFLGMLLGIAMAIFGEILRPKIRTDEDVRNLMGVEVLGVV
jgi:uncharacterized protein involved in exopolysaccharide biosynthesis